MPCEKFTNSGGSIIRVIRPDEKRLSVGQRTQSPGIFAFGDTSDADYWIFETWDPNDPYRGISAVFFGPQKVDRPVLLLKFAFN